MNKLYFEFLAVSAIIIGLKLYNLSIALLKLPFQILAWIGGLPPIQFIGNFVTKIFLEYPFRFIQFTEDTGKLNWFQRINYWSFLLSSITVIFCIVVSNPLWIIIFNIVCAVANYWITTKNIEKHYGKK